MRFLTLAGLLLLMAGCTGLPPRPVPESAQQSWTLRQQELKQIDGWQLKGRVAIVNGVEAWHLNVNWLQNDGDYRIEMWGPFGAGRVQLRGNEQGVRLIDSDQYVYYSTDPESLLYEHTGVKMPVAGLRYWILGLADPGQSQKQPVVDRYGRLASVQQNAWNVELQRYTRVGQMELPDKLSVNKDDLRVKMVVDNSKLKR
jgi:outer membrane lipoprotein LolB